MSSLRSVRVIQDFFSKRLASTSTLFGFGVRFISFTNMKTENLIYNYIYISLLIWGMKREKTIKKNEYINSIN